MIDEAILKKHNLKAVPFSCIGEGQTFYVLFNGGDYDRCLERRLVGDIVPYTNGRFNSPMILSGYLKYYTVYVPVWRPY